MAPKSLSFLAIFAMVAAANVFGAAAAFGGRKSLSPVEAPASAPASEEAFVVLDVRDAGVVEIAKFAVEEYNKENKSNLILEGIFTAAFTHTSEGIDYGFVITVNDGSGSQPYNANVLVNNGDKELIALWKKVGDSSDDDDN